MYIPFRKCVFHFNAAAAIEYNRVCVCLANIYKIVGLSCPVVNLMDVVRARKRANTSHKSEKCTADDIRENAKPRLRVEMNVQK